MLSWLLDVEHWESSTKVLQAPCGESCNLNSLFLSLAIFQVNPSISRHECVTGPLWRLLYSKLTVSKLSQAYQDMNEDFLRWFEDASVLLMREEMINESAELECARSDPVAE